MIYLDNAATTEPKYFRKDYPDYWLNSNMFYAKCENDELEDAKETIKKCLNVEDGKVLFFRCATEAIEWLCRKITDGTNMFICEEYEHDSLYNISNGHKEWYNHLIHDVYCHQLVNQMTGTIFSHENILDNALNHINNSHFRFIISDYTAAVGHIVLPTYHSFESIWFSGHKLGTEGGVGAMWISDDILEFIHHKNDNPRNQYNLVHGTLDVQGVLMLADAMEDVCDRSAIERNEDMYKMFTDILLKDLRAEGIDCRYVMDNKPRTHAINALYLNRINADALAHYLANEGIYVGLGSSACADDKDYRVLNAFGMSNDEASQIIRVSFCPSNTIQDVKKLSNKIIEFKDVFIGD